jgi:DNA invertase Pin-like site-specific DNA recombinase
MKRCALYGRVSTKDKGQDVENQLAQLRAFAASQGWEIAAEYIDEKTGGTSDRQAFQQMFKDASQRRFDVLLFWSLDRLSREGVLETLQHLNRLSDYGIGWRSFTEQFLDSTGPFRDAVVSILACIAKQEKARISERTVAGLERAKRNGKVLGRPRVVPDPTEILALRRKGVSWNVISRQTSVARATVRRVAALPPQIS